jgi:hypothetical protein
MSAAAFDELGFVLLPAVLDAGERSRIEPVTLPDHHGVHAGHQAHDGVEADLADAAVRIEVALQRFPDP